MEIPMTDQMVDLPALDRFRTEGGMFDVEPCDLDLHVGKRCFYTNPHRPQSGQPCEYGTFHIICVQKNCKGDVCLRITDDPFDIGHLVNPELITIIEE